MLQGRHLGGSWALQEGVRKWKLIDMYAGWEFVFGSFKTVLARWCSPWSGAPIVCCCLCVHQKLILWFFDGVIANFRTCCQIPHVSASCLQTLGAQWKLLKLQLSAALTCMRFYAQNRHCVLVITWHICHMRVTLITYENPTYTWKTCWAFSQANLRCSIKSSWPELHALAQDVFFVSIFGNSLV